MLFFFLLIIYCLLFAFLAWRNFHFSLVLFFFLLPTYLIRFQLGPLPTTLLETMLVIITIIWLIKYHKDIIHQLLIIIKQHKALFTAILLFLITASISIFTSSNLKSALGEWKAFYVQPILIFLIFITTFKQWHNNSITQSKIHLIIFALVLSGLITSILAIYQHFTGWLVPEAFWANRDTFRVTAWYGFPNAVGLFLAPLIPLTVYLIKENWNFVKKYKKQKANKLQISNFKSQTLEFGNWLLFVSCILYLVLAPLAIIYSRGTGPLIGVFVGIGFLLLVYKKTRWPTIITGLVSIVILISLPQMANLRQEILFQDRSGQIRLAIYKETWNFLKDNPLAGAGLASYSEKIVPYHTTVNGEGIEIFHHPHNIFLTMWVNLGLLGLLSFIGILISLFLIPYSLFKRRIKIPNIQFFLIASLTTILVIGLVDSPYIKNDLAILFWLLPAILLINQNYELENPKT